MQVQTIEVNGVARYVIRPNDRKALMRFLNKARAWMLRDAPGGDLTHRDASDDEAAKWVAAQELHAIWGGDDDQFFGIPI